MRHTAIDYRTAHNRICFAIVKRIYSRLKDGYDFGLIRVCNDKGMIVDGNHRYIAHLLANEPIRFTPYTSSRSDKPKGFNEVEVEEVDDWDANSSDPKKRRYVTDECLKDFKKLR